MKKIKFVFLLTFFLTAILQSDQAAAQPKPKLKVCLNNSTGEMVAKSKCSKTEKTVFIDTIISSITTAKGDTGATGPAGPQGPKGDTGANGVLGLGNSLPSGLTIFGYLELDTDTTKSNVDYRLAGSLPAPSPIGLTDSNVIVANNSAVSNACNNASCLQPAELAQSTTCTGSFQVPTAPSGFLCIYPNARVNFTSIYAASDNTFGFFISGLSASAGDVYFRATWAYKVP